jgi:AraC-like DNA-binding protein
MNGEMELEGVSFTHPRPGDTAAHTELFRAPVHFSGTACAIVFDRALSFRPVASADEATAEALEACAARLLSDRRVDGLAVDSLIERTRSAITTRLAEGVVALEPVARDLGLSPRTLQRKLQERRYSLSTLADEVRHAQAVRLLSRGATIPTIASVLGFNDLSAFYRAFRRWTGSTPGALRDAEGSVTALRGARERANGSVARSRQSSRGAPARAPVLHAASASRPIAVVRPGVNPPPSLK